MKPILLLISLTILISNAQAGLLVTDITGQAEVDSKGAVKLLSDIENGDRIKLKEGARVTAVNLHDGKEYVMTGAGYFMVVKDKPIPNKGGSVQEINLPAKGLPKASMNGSRVSQATLVMRSVASKRPPTPISPVNTALIEKSPSFKWSPVIGASSYQIRIYDNNEMLVFDGTGKGSSLQLPPEKILNYGKSYRWHIEALDNDTKVISDAKAEFTLVTESQRELLERMKVDGNNAFSRRVLYALQLEAAGAFMDAKYVWESLSMDRPDDNVLKSVVE